MSNRAAVPHIECVNPLAYERDIKELFVAHDRPEFPAAFDRAYPSASAAGGGSWIGRDPGGRVVMHIACMPRRFRLRGEDVCGGMLANLMVAKEHRSFFPALALVTRLIRDMRARGTIDFLYADPNDESRALLRGTRFRHVATLRRYVLPVSDGGFAAAMALRVWHGILRLRSGIRSRPKVVLREAGDYWPGELAAPDPQSERMIGMHDETLYATRLAAYPSARDFWVTSHPSESGGSPEAALLIRGPDQRGIAVLHAIRRRAGVRIRATVHAVTGELGRRGVYRLQVMTLAESKLADELCHAGFVPRTEAIPLFALPLTALGEDCTAAVRDWEMTDVECDR